MIIYIKAIKARDIIEISDERSRRKYKIDEFAKIIKVSLRSIIEGT